jgi:protein disulfide-isomerase
MPPQYGAYRGPGTADTAPLVSSRPPNQNTIRPPLQNGPSPAVGGNPPLAVDGYCPVTLVTLLSKDRQKAWKKGDQRWGAIHRGRTYLFAGPEEQRLFLANPDYYSPALSCYDPVRFVDANDLVEGRREHGLTYRGQVFLFADEASLRTFWNNPTRFATVVHEAMRRNVQSVPKRY